MATQADEEHTVDPLSSCQGIGVLALPLTRVSAPDKQRRDRTQPGRHPCVRLKQERQSLDYRKPADVQQKRFDSRGVSEGGEVGRGVSDAGRAGALIAA